MNTARPTTPEAQVCAEGSQLILATNLTACPSDAPSFAATILGMKDGIGLPTTVIADAGFASAEAVAALEAKGIEPLVAIGRTQPHRPYDVRPPPDPKPPRRISEPWRLKMQAKLETEDAKARYARHTQTVEPVFGIIKAAIGFTRFRLRSIANAAAEWTLIALALHLPQAPSPAAAMTSPPDRPKHTPQTQTRQAASGVIPAKVSRAGACR